MNETHEMKLILQAALEIARDQGKFERLERLCRKGQSAWTFPFFFDGGKVGRYEFVYEKSAGDCVCSFWIRKHMQHSGLNWLTNVLPPLPVFFPHVNHGTYQFRVSVLFEVDNPGASDSQI